MPSDIAFPERSDVGVGVSGVVQCLDQRSDLRVEPGDARRPGADGGCRIGRGADRRQGPREVEGRVDVIPQRDEELGATGSRRS